MNGIDGLPTTFTASANVTGSDTVFVLALIVGLPNAITLGPAASTIALGNTPTAAGFASFPAESRIAAPPESASGPPTRTPAGAKSPACTTVLKTSDFPPLPFPFQTANVCVLPTVIGKSGMPTTNTFSLKFTANDSTAPVP